MPPCGIGYGFEPGLWRHSKGGWGLHKSRFEIRFVNLYKNWWEIEMADCQVVANNHFLGTYAGICK